MRITKYGDSIGIAYHWNLYKKEWSSEIYKSEINRDEKSLEKDKSPRRPKMIFLNQI